MKRIVLIVLYLATTCSVSLTFADDSVSVQQSIGDIICGPKCVCEILHWYGKNEDVIRAIREIQYPEIQTGATLSALSDYLKKRNISTFAIKIKPSARIVSQYPVIVHLNPQTDLMLGHYVVWLPNSSGNEVLIWDGDKGIQKYNERQWSKERSGAVLLTSPEPITEPGDALQWVGLPFYDEVGFVFAWSVFISGIILFAATFRRTKK